MLQPPTNRLTKNGTSLFCYIKLHICVSAGSLLRAVECVVFIHSFYYIVLISSSLVHRFIAVVSVHWSANIRIQFLS